MTATHPGSTTLAARSQRGIDAGGGQRKVRVGIIGATGYVGSELIRLLSRHPNATIVGLQGATATAMRSAGSIRISPIRD